MDANGCDLASPEALPSVRLMCGGGLGEGAWTLARVP